jgi:hypothetical protein
VLVLHDPLEQVGGHRLGQVVAADDELDASARAREVHRRLTGRVARADHDDVVVAAGSRL